MKSDFAMIFWRPELKAKLISFKYPNERADSISSIVVQLTDAYTAEAYPGLRKKARKIESDRLLTIDSDAQTVN
jgi:hypothetical protein